MRFLILPLILGALALSACGPTLAPDCQIPGVVNYSQHCAIGGWVPLAPVAQPAVVYISPGANGNF